MYPCTYPRRYEENRFAKIRQSSTESESTKQASESTQQASESQHGNRINAAQQSNQRSTAIESTQHAARQSEPKERTHHEFQFLLFLAISVVHILTWNPKCACARRTCGFVQMQVSACVYICVCVRVCVCERERACVQEHCAYTVRESIRACRIDRSGRVSCTDDRTLCMHSERLFIQERASGA